jgi:glyoxylase-like metal-dependent hydrolase (beta-lactamase superfamily II)
MNSLQTILVPLPPETTIFSGHGPKTTIGEELRYNPYLQ